MIMKWPQKSKSARHAASHGWSGVVDTAYALGAWKPALQPDAFRSFQESCFVPTHGRSIIHGAQPLGDTSTYQDYF
jgi:hypothetical protein